MPSPLSYINNYNKICGEEAEQTKQCIPIDRKHSSMFLWNDGYVQLNRIHIPSVVEDKKIKKKTFQASMLQQIVGSGTQAPQNNHQISMHNNNSLNANYNQSNIQNVGNIQNLNSNQNQTANNNTSSLNKNEQNIESNNNSQDISLDQENNNDDNAHKSAKQIKERKEDKKLTMRTQQLEKMIEQNNAHLKKMKNKDQGSVSKLQRKFFSHTQQQMSELQNHILGSSKMSKEIMDRKGLSLRKVLSSIPQEKLIQIIDSKQYHFMKIMNEKILPKKEFRLKSQLLPRFTGISNYDLNKPSTASKQSHNQSCNTPQKNTHSLTQFGKEYSHYSKEIHGRKSLLDMKNNVFFPHSNPQLYSSNVGSSQQLDQLKSISSQGIPGDRKRLSIMETSKLAKVYGNYTGTSSNHASSVKGADSASKVMREESFQLTKSNSTKKVSLLGVDNLERDSLYKSTIPEEKMVLDADGLYYYEGMDELLGKAMATYSNNINHRKNESRALNSSQINVSQNSMEKNGGMRVRGQNEVNNTITKLQEIQQQSIHSQQSTVKDNSNQLLQLSNEALNQMNSIISKPKQYIDKVLQKDDLQEKSILLCGLDNIQKTNQKKNFFNYSSYFYSKYSKQNNGLSTKLSSTALNDNSAFESDLLNLISMVNQDYPDYSTSHQI